MTTPPPPPPSPWQQPQYEPQYQVQYPPPPPPSDQWEVLGAADAPEPARPHRGRLIASIVAVVAIAGGGVATYVAVNDSSDRGAASPREAVEKIVDDINKSDLLGVLDDLVP